MLVALALLRLPPGMLCAQAPAASAVPDSTLRVLDFLTGQWRIPPGDSLLERRPELAGMLVIDAEWAVGGKAIRYREHIFPDSARGAELEGLIYWDPAREQIRYIAVAGHGEGQGRLFVGEFMPLGDGRVEKVYDVYYRSLADTPGEGWAARGAGSARCSSPRGRTGSRIHSSGGTTAAGSAGRAVSTRWFASGVRPPDRDNGRARELRTASRKPVARPAVRPLDDGRWSR